MSLDVNDAGDGDDDGDDEFGGGDDGAGNGVVDVDDASGKGAMMIWRCMTWGMMGYDMTRRAAKRKDVRIFVLIQCVHITWPM